MNALFYLETRWAKNVALEILRSPLRSTLWALYLGFLALMLVLRVIASRAAHAEVAFSPSLELATAIGGGYLAALGVAMVVFGGGRVAAFRSRTDARMLAQAPLARTTIAFWLALRKLALAATRWLPTLLFYALVAISPEVAARALAGPLLAGTLAAATFVSLELPCYLIARRLGAVTVQAVGVVLAISGSGWAVLSLITSGSGAPAARPVGLLGWSPGTLTDALLRGDGAALLAFALIPLGLTALTVVLGRSAIPELYEVSARTLAFAERRSAGRSGAFLLAAAPPRRSGYVPPGPFVVVWKDWLGFRRSRGALAWWLALTVAAATVGLVVAAPIARDYSIYGPILFGTAVLFGFAVPVASSIDIAGDVSKPIWWLSAAPLRRRLWALVFARSWRGAVTIAVVPAIVGLALGSVWIVTLALPVTLALWWSLYAASLALSVAISNRLDARGPLFFVRVSFAAAVLVPPLAALYITSGLGSVAAGAVTVAVALAEAFGLVEFAATRLSRDAALLPAA